MPGITQFRFGPLIQTKGWEYTLTPGAEPSQIVATFLEADVQALDGPIHSVIITYSSPNDNAFFVLTDCHLVMARTKGGGSAKLSQVTIQDRRWRWKFAHIDGNYNIKQPDGSYVREKTPRELAGLLFDAMGEVDYNVQALPDDTRPEVSWQSASAAQEMSSLCQSLGCFPTLHPNLNKAEIHAFGVGAGLPAGGKVKASSQVVSATPLPKSIRVVGGPMLFQSRLKLGEALGEDTDGELKPFSELSYFKDESDFQGKPFWQTQVPGGMFDVTGIYQKEGKSLLKRRLAADSVYRIYRITGRAAAEEGATGADLWSPDSLNGSGDGEADFAPTRLDEIIPLRSVKLTTHTDPDGRKVENKAAVHGTFTLIGFDGHPSKDGDKWPFGFSIDSKAGIVRFSRPIYIHNSEGAEQNNPYYEPAEIELETSYQCNKDGVIIRYEEFLDNSDTSAFGSFRLPKPELVVRTIETDPPEDNTEEVSAAGQKYLQALLNKFEIRQGREVEYSGIKNLALDGIIRQITWSSPDGQASTTRASLNMEANPYIPNFERRAQEQADRAKLEKDRIDVIFQAESGSIWVE